MTKQTQAHGAISPPGSLVAVAIGPGGYDDYRRLARFHYRPGRPATLAKVFRAVVRFRTGREELAGVLVLSFPVPCCAERHCAFATGSGGLGANLLFANRELRTISRLIVHPRFRGLSIATQLVRRAIAECPTRYVEARSHLGLAVPLFERAGMTRVPPVAPGRPAYYWAETGGTNEKVEEGDAGESARAV